MIPRRSWINRASLNFDVLNHPAIHILGQVLPSEDQVLQGPLSLFRIASWLLLLSSHYVIGQTVITIDTDLKHQTIDGFGAFQGGNLVNESWWQELFFADLKASIYRVDLTPKLISPYSDLRVYSPWFMGSGTQSVFNFEDPANPNGPEGNRVRTYTGPEDYGREFGGLKAPIAVMGPDIEYNKSLFKYERNDAISVGISSTGELGDFKLIGSIWSPLPWLKVTSGNMYPHDWWPGPVSQTPWPFVWGGNYAGGKLDVSERLLDVFDDSSLGGDGPTSSLTQFARSTAAYIKGYQDFHKVTFYAISLQNELNFEQYYNSTTYPLSSQYIAALKAIRSEFEQHPSLRDIKIMGPEDLLGNEYGLWQFGGNDDPTHKNLQYLMNIAADEEAFQAIDFFCIHGYDRDGVSAGQADPIFWEYWKNGWMNSPAPGIPPDVPGFSFYKKKSWMTETSGEVSEWLSPPGGFPGFGAWSIGLRIHQALTVGDQSAWVYWTFVDEDNQGNVTPMGLTSASLRQNAPKYVAAKHFFNPIRPESVRVSAHADPETGVLASAYLHGDDSTLVIVALNISDHPEDLYARLSSHQDRLEASTFLSHESHYWQPGELTFQSGRSDTITMPPYSIISITVDLINETTHLQTWHDLEPSTHLHFDIRPNPSKGDCWLSLTLAHASEVRLSLHDVAGKKLKEITRGWMREGLHQIHLPTAELVSGTYLLELATNKIRRVKKIVVE